MFPDSKQRKKKKDTELFLEVFPTEFMSLPVAPEQALQKCWQRAETKQTLVFLNLNPSWKK